MNGNTTKAFAVYDIKSELFSPPHFQETNGVAIRSFGEACLDDKTQMGKHPEDFSLYCIGDYNIETGEFTSLLKPLQISNATEFKQ